MLIVDTNSKYKMCPQCRLSNNPIKEKKVDINQHPLFQDLTKLTCIVCNFTTDFKVNAPYWWNQTGNSCY